MDPAHKWYLNPMHMCMQTHAHSTYTEVTLFIPNISFLKSNQWNLWGPSVCNPATSTSISGHNTLPASLSPIYHPHISINNQVGIQLVTWKACESHVTDQSSREAAHSLRWFTAQQFVPRSAWIHAVYLLYMKLSRLEICICQMSPITPAACHTWGSSQPTRKKDGVFCQHRTLSGLKRHQLPHFSVSHFLKTQIFFWVSSWMLG